MFILDNNEILVNAAGIDYVERIVDGINLRIIAHKGSRCHELFFGSYPDAERADMLQIAERLMRALCNGLNNGDADWIPPNAHRLSQLLEE